MIYIAFNYYSSIRRDLIKTAVIGIIMVAVTAASVVTAHAVSYDSSNGVSTGYPGVGGVKSRIMITSPYKCTGFYCWT